MKMSKVTKSSTKVKEVKKTKEEPSKLTAEEKKLQQLIEREEEEGPKTYTAKLSFIESMTMYDKRYNVFKVHDPDALPEEVLKKDTENPGTKVIVVQKRFCKAFLKKPSEVQIEISTFTNDKDKFIYFVSKIYKKGDKLRRYV